MLKKFITLTVLSFGILFSGFQVTHAQDMNCADFTNDPQGLMDFWHSNGYSATNDPHDLDRDNDGLPCEVSQADYDEYVADLQANEGGTETNEGETQIGEGMQGGGTLPETATNNPIMMALGIMTAAIGALFLLRKKQVD